MKCIKCGASGRVLIRGEAYCWHCYDAHPDVTRKAPADRWDDDKTAAACRAKSEAFLRDHNIRIYGSLVQRLDTNQWTPEEMVELARWFQKFGPNRRSADWK